MLGVLCNGVVTAKVLDNFPASGSASIIPGSLASKTSVQLSAFWAFSSRVSHEDCIWQPGQPNQCPCQPPALASAHLPYLTLALLLHLSLCPYDCLLSGFWF